MAIRRRRTSRGASGSTQAAKAGGGGGGVKAMQNVVWEWLAPTALLTPSVSFDLAPYAGAQSQTGVITMQDVLEMMNSGSFQACGFPVYPRVGLTSLLVRTNIPAFTQYADVPVEEIPLSVAENIRIDSDKGFYVGCDDGTANISQSDVRLRAYPKINGIQSFANNEVIVALLMNDLAENSFITSGNQPFFPYNLQTNPVGGVPFLGDAYLNNGQISVTGIRAIYVAGNKATSPASLNGNFDFSLG